MGRRAEKFLVRFLQEILLKEFWYWLKTAHYHGSRSFSFAFVQYHVYEVNYAMARPKSKNTKSDNVDTAKIKYRTEWVNCRLSDDDSPVILESAENPDAMFAVLARHCAQDGGFSIRYDTDKSSFSAFIFTPANPSTGVLTGISAYGKTALIAVAACLLKYELYLAGSDRISQSGKSLGFG